MNRRGRRCRPAPPCQVCCRRRVFQGEDAPYRAGGAPCTAGFRFGAYPATDAGVDRCARKEEDGPMGKAQAPTPANEPAVQAMPGPLPRLPGRPPAEPIVIRTPPRRPRDDLEIDGSVDEEEGGEIRRQPGWVPDLPPPQQPEERAVQS